MSTSDAALPMTVREHGSDGQRQVQPCAHLLGLAVVVIGFRLTPPPVKFEKSRAAVPVEPAGSVRTTLPKLLPAPPPTKENVSLPPPPLKTPPLAELVWQRRARRHAQKARVFDDELGVAAGPGGEVAEGAADHDVVAAGQVDVKR